MGYTIDIDTGSTFTDGFFTCGAQVERVKVDTTPHDLTVCFMNCIEEGGRRLGFQTAKDLLRKTEVVRFSSTVGTNALIQQTGPKLGLIVSKGFEGSLYSTDGGRNPLFDFIVSGSMVIGVEGEIDGEGREKTPIQEEEIKTVTRQLLEDGARVIVVSLLRSSINPAHEKKVKEIIHQEYPPYYLGTVTVLLASELTCRSDDALRTNGVLVNAYLHKDMVRYLYKADEDLRRLGYKRPLLVVHNRPGAARVAKTTAISTCDAGPAAAMAGSAFMSKRYGLTNTITMEIGGTSCDLGVMVSGKYSFNPTPKVQGISVTLPMVELSSIGVAGGSIAGVDRASGTLAVGPRSAGATPGPACFGLGGTDATVLDAEVVLGKVNPDYFLGGKRKLNRQKAEKVVRDRIAGPLDLPVERAALQIRERVVSQVGEAIKGLLAERQRNPADFVLFSCGGSGGLFCADIAAYAGIKQVYTFVYSSVFGAFGSSTMDVVHHYERAISLPLQTGPHSYLGDVRAINQAMHEMRTAALRDTKGEGFEAQAVAFDMELELRDAAGTFSSVIRWPKLSLENEGEIKSICDAFLKEYSEIKRKPFDFEAGSIVLEILGLRANCPVLHSELPEHALATRSPEEAMKDSREVYWSQAVLPTPIFERRLLKCGNVVEGPAIVESEDTTLVVPAGRKFSVDKYLNGVIEEI